MRKKSSFGGRVRRQIWQPARAGAFYGRVEQRESAGVAFQSLQTGKYRYGFNGKEVDKDWKSCSYDYGFRIYDARVCRFLSVDPLTKEYPWYTPYQFAGNMPIEFIDLDGQEPAKPDKVYWQGDGWYISKAFNFVAGKVENSLHYTGNFLLYGTTMWTMPIVHHIGDALGVSDKALYYLRPMKLNTNEWDIKVGFLGEFATREGGAASFDAAQTAIEYPLFIAGMAFKPGQSILRLPEGWKASAGGMAFCSLFGQTRKFFYSTLEEKAKNELSDDVFVGNDNQIFANYTIKKGDWLSKIAYNFGLGAEDLLKVNPQISNPDKIFEGDMLNILIGNIEPNED